MLETALRTALRLYWGIHLMLQHQARLSARRNMEAIHGLKKQLESALRCRLRSPDPLLMLFRVVGILVRHRFAIPAGGGRALTQVGYAVRYGAVRPRTVRFRRITDTRDKRFSVSNCVSLV